MKKLRALISALLLVILHNTHTGEVENPILGEFLDTLKENKGNNKSHRHTESDDTPGCECVPYDRCRNTLPYLHNEKWLLNNRMGSGRCAATHAKYFYQGICCGKSNIIRRSKRSVKAQFEKTSWIVAVLGDQVDSKNVDKCNGALIHSKVVLTAAHCVYGKNPSDMKIRAGQWHTQLENYHTPYLDRKVYKIIVHDGYGKKTLQSNIALIILQSPIDVAENVNLVSLPKQGSVFERTRCLVSGWKKYIPGNEKVYKVILENEKISIAPYNECEAALQSHKLGNFKIHERFICAWGVSKKRTCRVEEGSPLVCPIKDDPSRYQLVGILTWGVGCGLIVPRVYVNVPLFREWIDIQLSENGLNISTS